MPKLSSSTPRPEKLVTCIHVLKEEAAPRVSANTEVVCEECFESQTEEFLKVADFVDLDAKLNGNLAGLLKDARVKKAAESRSPDDLLGCTHVLNGKVKPLAYRSADEVRVVCNKCFKSETEEFLKVVSFSVLDAKLNGLAELLAKVDIDEDEDEPEFEDPDEKAFLADGKRQDEAGTVSEENVEQDYIFLTKWELGEDGAPKRNQRTDHEIHQQLMENPTLIPPRCKIHGVPGCFNCGHIPKLVQYYRDHPDKRTTAGLPTPPKYSVTPVAKVLSLEEEVRQFQEKSRIEKAAKNPTQPKPKKWEPKKIENLRRIHGYSVRDLASCFDDSGFNGKVNRTDHRLLFSDERIPKKHFYLDDEIRNMKWRELHQQIVNGERAGLRHPQTMAELLNMLPLRLFPLFTHAQVDFYRDYANGNFRMEEMQYRIANGFYGRAGFETQDYLVLLENRIIVRGWQRLLLKPKTEVRVEDFDRLLGAGYDMETLAIASGAASIGGRIVSAKWNYTEGKPVVRYGLDSFEHSGQIKDGGGAGDFSQEGTPDYDNFGDEGQA